ncbi:MAG: hypothetical protein FJ247_07125 [Nitrospira sp.]|nr:hypothetical protein [Nitrospira sp.]
MVLAGLFASMLFIGLILGDWLYFVRFTPDAIRYGCSVARTQDRWTASAIETVRSRFSADGVLMLPHGVARFYPDVSQIAIRPKYRFFSIGFRSAWPVKGLIHLSAGGQAGDHMIEALCVKRIPWSSALMTLLWFGVVLIGSLVFVVAYALDGGFASLEGVFMGVGLVAGALLVLAAGLVTVTMSYRLEHNRLMQVYEELRDALGGAVHPSSSPVTP